MTDEDAVRQAVLSLEAALDEEYPGEFIDPAALRIVLDELKRLQGIAQHGDEMPTGDAFFERFYTANLMTVNPWWMGQA